MTSVGLGAQATRPQAGDPASPETETGAADRETKWAPARSELVMTSDSS